MSGRVEGALDIMRSADAEPNGSKAFDSHDCYRLYRAADRSAEHDRYFSSATSGEWVLHRLVRFCAPVAVKRPFKFPGRPDDSSNSVRQSDGCFVVPTLAFALERPLTQSVQWSTGSQRTMRRQQGLSCTVHQ